MPPRRRVLYLDPYHTASHRSLALALRERSRHDLTLLTLPPRKWKWRMRGAALAFEPEVRRLTGPPAGVLVSTDFLNLPEFLALTRDIWPQPIPAILYFHENQLTYPSPSHDARDFHFGLVNVHSALAADRVLFNSRFHLEDFLAAAAALIGKMPDFRPAGIAERIRAKSEVLGVPLDLASMDRARAGRKEPWILWNHRWEEDRNPAAFFEAIEALDRRAARGEAPDFRLVVAGQTYQTRPAIFDAARERLAHRIESWGFVESREKYLDLVARCSVCVSTSLHEFFGVSVMEAIYLGCVPVLPRRLAYPEIVGADETFLYDRAPDLPEKIAEALAGTARGKLEPVREGLRRHDIGRVVARWDEILDAARVGTPSK